MTFRMRPPVPWSRNSLRRTGRCIGHGTVECGVYLGAPPTPRRCPTCAAARKAEREAEAARREVRPVVPVGTWKALALAWLHKQWSRPWVW